MSLLDSQEKQLLFNHPLISLAELLHKFDCHQNHTDGCGWCYETWEKVMPAISGTRGRYYKWAKNICDSLSQRNPSLSFEQIIELAEQVLAIIEESRMGLH